ncbi:MAG: hypothetical protein WAT79_05650 [Saprospiraceae bacterium]
MMKTQNTSVIIASSLPYGKYIPLANRWKIAKTSNVVSGLYYEI